MDVHSIGGPQRSAKSFYSSQSPFNRDRQLKHPCGLADRAASIDRRDCGGANSLLLQRVMPSRWSPGSALHHPIPRIRAGTATMRRYRSRVRRWL